MGTISYTIPTAGSTPNSVADPEVATALQTILTWANGNVDTNNLSPSAAITATQIAAALAQSAMVNQAGQTVKGSTSIAASESRSNTAYGTLTTPDQVTGITLPTSGLIAVWYQATWQESVSQAARAAIFIGATQLKVAQGGVAAPATQAAASTSGGLANTNWPLASAAHGLVSFGTTAVSSYGGDVTTGQAVALLGSAGVGAAYDVGGTLFNTSATASLQTPLGGPCYVFAAAGTYTISVQFKASSGSVTAANRKLWVQALSFS